MLRKKIFFSPAFNCGMTIIQVLNRSAGIMNVSNVALAIIRSAGGGEISEGAFAQGMQVCLLLHFV